MLTLRYLFLDGSGEKLDHATLIGVSDPTGLIRQGCVYLTGFGCELPAEVFVTVTPSGEANDGIVVPVDHDLPSGVKSYLDNLSFGAIVFALGDDHTLIPPELDDGDLDGDLFLVLWNRDLILMIQDSEGPPRFEVMPDDDLVPTDFQIERDGSFCDAEVVERLDDGLYRVETGKDTKTSIQMTREEILKDRKCLSQVLGHRVGKKSHPTEFHLEWIGGKKEWVALRTVREEYPDCGPPLQLIEYVHNKGLLNESGPKDCKWVKRFVSKLGRSELARVTSHQLKDTKIELLCLYNDDVERWKLMEEVEQDGKLQIAEYARDKNLFQREEFKKARAYWLRAVQDFYCVPAENRARDISLLRGRLYRKFKESNNEYGPNDTSTRVWIRAYKKLVSTTMLPHIASSIFRLLIALSSS